MKSCFTPKYSLTAIITFVTAVTVNSQYNPTYKDPLTRTLDKSSTKVGTLPGSMDVNSLGAATYTIPLFISPGSAGMQPSVSLVYNSLIDDGVLGKGWDIGGLSDIRRIPQNYYNDNNVIGVTLQNTDRFALDSNRLLLISGTYGGDGSVYYTEINNFAKIPHTGQQEPDQAGLK